MHLLFHSHGHTHSQKLIFIYVASYEVDFIYLTLNMEAAFPTKYLDKAITFVALSR